MSTGVVTSMVTKTVPKNTYFNVILFAGGQLPRHKQEAQQAKKDEKTKPKPIPKPKPTPKSATPRPGTSGNGRGYQFLKLKNLN